MSANINQYLGFRSKFSTIPKSLYPDPEPKSLYPDPEPKSLYPDPKSLYPDPEPKSLYPDPKSLYPDPEPKSLYPDTEPKSLYPESKPEPALIEKNSIMDQMLVEAEKERKEAELEFVRGREERVNIEQIMKYSLPETPSRRETIKAEIPDDKQQQQILRRCLAELASLDETTLINRLKK